MQEDCLLAEVELAQVEEEGEGAGGESALIPSAGREMEEILAQERADEGGECCTEEPRCPHETFSSPPLPPRQGRKSTHGNKNPTIFIPFFVYVVIRSLIIRILRYITKVLFYVIKTTRDNLEEFEDENYQVTSSHIS